MANRNSSESEDDMGSGPDHEEKVSDDTRSKHETEVKSNETQQSNEKEIPREGSGHFTNELQDNDNREQVRTLNESLKEKDSQITALENQLSQKNEAIEELRLSVQKTREDLEERNRRERQASDEKLRKKEEELRDDKRRHVTEIRERESKVEELDKRLRVVESGFAESSIKWNKDRGRAERAAEETKQQRKLKNREKWRRLIILIGARNRKRILKDELMKQVHEVLGQCEGFKLQLETASTEIENIQRQKEEEISQLQLELQGVIADNKDTVEGLRDQLDQSELRQTELHDLMTDYQHKLGYLQGANNIGHAWVQKMSEEAAQCRINQELMYNEGIALKTELERTQTEVKTLKEKVQAMMVEKVDYANKLEISYMKNYNTDREKEELQVTVELLREEVNKAGSALSRARQKDEEKCEELEKKNQERRKLVNDIINLRRILESTKSEKERLRISCTHLRGELQQI